MENYDPLISPDPDEWQALDESEQMRLVEDFHIDANEDVPESGWMMHVGVHVIVENQNAMDVKPVPETIAKLVRQGLDRHEAVHAIGAILCGEMYHLLNADEKSWNEKRCRRRLEKLTAKRWKKGQW